MGNLIRTEKEFTKANLPLDFLRRATALGGVHGRPLHFNEEDFEIVELWQGVHPTGGSTVPWSDEDAERGFVKKRFGVRVNNNTDFDTNITIFESGRLQGFFKSGKLQYAIDHIDWCNLLLEYRFLTFNEG